MNWKPIAIMALVLWLANFVVGFITGWIPDFGNPMIGGAISLVITAFLVLTFYKYLRDAV